MLVAQLRDVLTAEDSTVVAKKAKYDRVFSPETSEAYKCPIRVGEGDLADGGGP